MKKKSLAEANEEYYQIDFRVSKEELLKEIKIQIGIYWQEVGPDMLTSVGGEAHYDEAVEGYKDLVMDRLWDHLEGQVTLSRKELNNLYGVLHVKHH